MFKSTFTVAVFVLIALACTCPATAQFSTHRLPVHIEQVLTNSNLRQVLEDKALQTRFSANTSFRDQLQAIPRPTNLPLEYSHQEPWLIRPAARSSQQDSPSAETSIGIENRTNDPENPGQQPNAVKDGNRPPSPKKKVFKSSVYRSLGDSSSEKRFTQEEQAADNAQESSAAASTEVDQLAQLQIRLLGVSAMIQETPTVMVVEVVNPTEKTLGPVDVNVQVPATLSVTRFDREAWLDNDRRIVAFRLDQISPKSSETIRLRAVFLSAGEMDLQVLLSSGRTIATGREFTAQVYPRQSPAASETDVSP